MFKERREIPAHEGMKSIFLENRWRRCDGVPEKDEVVFI